VVWGDARARPEPEVRPAEPAPLDPERFTRARHHREPPARRTVHRVREVLGVDASREVREATARAGRGSAGRSPPSAAWPSSASAAAPARRPWPPCWPPPWPPPAPDLGAVPGLGSLALRAGGPRRRRSGRSPGRRGGFAEAEPQLARGDGGLWLLTGDRGRLDLPAYQAAVAALSRFFAVLVTDCGPDPAAT
jgi:hypothetical protein